MSRKASFCVRSSVVDFIVIDESSHMTELRSCDMRRLMICVIWCFSRSLVMKNPSSMYSLMRGRCLKM